MEENLPVWGEGGGEEMMKNDEGRLVELEMREEAG